MEAVATRIVMIGGGYACHGAWKTLRARIPDLLSSGRVEVTVISAANYHYFHGFIGEMISGVVGVAAGMSPARAIFAGTRFVSGRVTRVDLQGRRVIVAAAGGELAIGYDHLVVGTGARYRRDGVPGLAEHGWALRDLGALQGFRNHVIGCLERADARRDDALVRRALTFVVAGGGFAGVEITAALGELLRAMGPHYAVLQRVPPRLVLVHSGRRILAEAAAQESLVRYAERQLESGDIEVLTETRVAAAEAGWVKLSSGAVIETDTLLSTIGNEVTPLPGLEHLGRDDQRRLRADDFLRVPDGGSLWVAGDCASIAHPRTGRTCPSNALWAVKQGEHIGRNLARVLTGQAPRPFAFRGLGVAASMGLGKGMGELFGVPVTGWAAWLARLLVFLYFMPSRRQAVSALLEHLKLPFCGRSLVPLDVSVLATDHPRRPPHGPFGRLSAPPVVDPITTRLYVAPNATLRPRPRRYRVPFSL